MRYPTKLSAALFGGWCWLFASVTFAAAPYNSVSLDDDSPVANAAVPSESAAAPSATGQLDGPVMTCRQPDCTCYSTQAWANALFLTRVTSGGISWAFGDPGDPKGSEIFETGEIDFGYSWGPSVGFARCLDPCTSLGVQFYAVDGWSSEGQVDGDISVQFPSFPYLPDNNYGLATYWYDSYLFNTEVNILRRSGCAEWLSFLAGFRWIELGEEFGTVFETGGTTPNYLINVNNHMYGFQLGALANVRRRGPWSVDAWMKAGIFANSADQETMEDFTSVGGQRISVTARDTSTAFAGDIGLSLARQITDRLTARVGYMALWVEGVALAPEQLDNSDPSVGTASLDTGNGVFYHGGFVGAEYLW